MKRLSKLRMIFVIFFLHLLADAQGQSSTPQWATVKAFLPRWEDAEIILKINNTAVHKDRIRSGMFSYNFKTEGVSEASIEVKGRSSTHLFFFAEPGVIRITDNGRSLQAKGTPYNDRYFQLENEWDSLARADAGDRLANVKSLKQQLVARQVEKEPTSPVSLRLLYQFYYAEKNASDTAYYRLYHLLSPELKATATGKKIEQEVKERYKVAIGRPAPFSLLPDAGKILQPVYEKGQYTLIHFWASWCRPCGKFNQQLKVLHDSLPPGLAFTGISVDANYAAWTNAISKEKLEWKQLSDLKGWSGGAALNYSVESIPSNILVDPNGIIIARNVSVDDLRKIFREASQKTF